MKAIFTFVFISFFTLGAWSQSPPGPFLSSADIDRFLANGLQMMSEFETIDDQLEDESGEESYEEILNYYQTALKDNEAREILLKYGWDPDTFAQKMMAISMGFTYLMTVKYMKDLPPEQQAMMEEMFAKESLSHVHPDDIEVIRPKYDELEILFKEDQ